MKNRLEIQNLKINTYGYNSQTILDIPHYQQDDVSELLITGAKGAGKTTFLYALAGMFLKIDGKVKWNGKSIYDLSPSERDGWNANKVGFIYQSYQLNDDLSILDNILLPTGFDSVICPEPLMLRAEQLADRFGISIFSPIEKLSAAQKQYIAIARALINDVDIVIADDLTAGLSMVAAATLLNHLREECADNHKLLLIASDAGIVKEQVNDQFKLEDGRIATAKLQPLQHRHSA